MDMTEKVLGEGLFMVDSMDEAFFKGKYDLTTTEAAAMLDISERYLCDLLKDNFDYIMPKAFQKQCFHKDNITDTLSMNRSAFMKMKWRIEDQDEQGIKRYFHGLIRKRMFIQRQSFRQFMINNIKVVRFRDGHLVQEPIQVWQVDHIMKGKLTVVSNNTLKAKLRVKHNMQVYRHVQRMDYQKIHLVANSTEQPIVRFLLPKNE